MSVSDNYGARWVKAILNWFRVKTTDGVEKENIIRDALLECGLRKNKTIEILNEFIEMGFIKEKKGLIYWGDMIPVNPEMQPYLEAKKKIKEKKEVNNNKNEDLYNIYVISCKNDGEEPLKFEDWMERVDKK